MMGYARVLVAILSTAVLGLGCQAKDSSKEQVQAVEVEALASEPPAPEPAAAPKPPPPPPGQPDPRAIYYVPLEGDEPQRGPDDALFTIVAFGDYQCPFCKGSEETMKQLLDKYPGEIRVVWMNFPLPGHPHARPAATAALEARAQKGNAGFWEMHDRLFENQGALSRSDLERYAKEQGLNVRKFREALDTDKHTADIERDLALGEQLGFPGTPAFYMNGQYMAGFPLKTWEAGMQLRRSLYERAVQQGVPKAELYERIIVNGKRTR